MKCILYKRNYLRVPWKNVDNYFVRESKKLATIWYFQKQVQRRNCKLYKKINSTMPEIRKGIEKDKIKPLSK